MVLPFPSNVMSDVMSGLAAPMVMSAVRRIVSEPLPAGQPPVAVSVLAAVIASARLHVPLTVIVAANDGGA